MPDVFSKKIRSQIMSKIHSSKTKIELIVKNKLNADFIYQSKEFGKPDFINYKKQIIIFVDGCFWHSCLLHSKKPKQNKNYWIPKLQRNLIKREEVKIAYKSIGWKVIRIWEHELKSSIPVQGKF